MPYGVHNGNGTKGKRRAQAVAALAQGEPITLIAKRLNMGHSTLNALETVEWAELSRVKALLAEQAERGALEAGIKVIDAVRNGGIYGPALIPAYGVFVDKALALRGDAGLTIKHEHTHSHQVELVQALKNAHEKAEKRIQDRVIDVSPTE